MYPLKLKGTGLKVKWLRIRKGPFRLVGQIYSTIVLFMYLITPRVLNNLQNYWTIGLNGFNGSFNWTTNWTDNGPLVQLCVHMRSSYLYGLKPVWSSRSNTFVNSLCLAFEKR